MYTIQGHLDNYCDCIKTWNANTEVEISKYLQNGCVVTGKVFWCIFEKAPLEYISYILNTHENIDVNYISRYENLLTKFIKQPIYTEKIIFLLRETNIDIEFIGSQNFNPLALAFIYDNIIIFRELIRQSATLNNIVERNISLLHPNPVIYVDLLVNSLTFRTDPLYHDHVFYFITIYKKNNIKELSNFIEASPHYINDTTFLKLLVNGRNLTMINFILSNYPNDIDVSLWNTVKGTFFSSIMSLYGHIGSINEIMTLINNSKGFDLNNQEFFNFICERGLSDICNLIIGKIDRNIINPISNDRYESPLMVACINYNCDIIDTLIDYDANVNFIFNNNSIMIEVLKNKDRNGYKTGVMSDVIDRLLKHNIDVNYVNDEGKTAIFYADTPDIINKLVIYGANLNIHDRSNKTVLYYAIVNFRMDLIDTILGFGQISISNNDMKIVLKFGVSYPHEVEYGPPDTRQLYDIMLTEIRNKLRAYGFS